MRFTPVLEMDDPVDGRLLIEDLNRKEGKVDNWWNTLTIGID